MISVSICQIEIRRHRQRHIPQYDPILTSLVLRGTIAIEQNRTEQNISLIEPFLPIRIIQQNHIASRIPSRSIEQHQLGQS